MNLLALDTSTPVCAVALCAGDQSLYETVQAGNTHSQLALPMIESLLQKANIAFSDLDAIAFGAGPGSFTGVRIACALAQGIAFAQGKLVVPVSTLAAVAFTCAEQIPSAKKIWVANDARMNEVYCAGFVQDTRGVWNEDVPVRVCAPAEAMPDTNEDWILAGDAFNAYPEMLHGRDGGDSMTTSLSANGLLAASIAAYNAGLATHPRDAEPYYVRNKVAFTEAERAQKKALA